MSGGYTDEPKLAAVTGEDVEKYRLVYFSADRTVKKAYPGVTVLGTMNALTKSGYEGTVNLLNKPGSLEMMANAAITQYAPVYCVEDGKVDDVGVGEPLGWALEAATADEDVIQVLLAGRISGYSHYGDKVILEDDFFEYVDGDQWTIISNDGGTAAVADAAGGVLTLGAAGATNNDQTWLKQKLETWLFAAAKPIYFQARVKLTEQATDDANILVGLINAVADDHLQDDGAGPPASYSGMVFFKVDGGTVWQGEVSVGAVQVTDTSVGTFTTAAWHTLEMYYVPTSTTAGTVHFIVDGTLGGSSAFTFTGATEMQIAFGIKNGSAASESLLIDYVYCEQVR